MLSFTEPKPAMFDTKKTSCSGSYRTDSGSAKPSIVWTWTASARPGSASHAKAGNSPSRDRAISRSERSRTEWLATGKP